MTAGRSRRGAAFIVEIAQQGLLLPGVVKKPGIPRQNPFHLGTGEAGGKLFGEIVPLLLGLQTNEVVPHIVKPYTELLPVLDPLHLVQQPGLAVIVEIEAADHVFPVGMDGVGIGFQRRLKAAAEHLVAGGADIIFVLVTIAVHGRVPPVRGGSPGALFENAVQLLFRQLKDSRHLGRGGELLPGYISAGCGRTPGRPSLLSITRE